MNASNAVDFFLRAMDKTSALHELVIEYTSEAYNQSANRGKASAILAVFRTTDSNWRAFCRKLKDKLVGSETIFDIDLYEDFFIETLSKTHPELYMLCVQNKVFTGHVPSFEQRTRMNQAELTLRNDRQQRLALRLYNLL